MYSSTCRWTFKRQGPLGAFFDWLLRPVMYWLQGTWHEEPQRTHFWNNQKLNPLTSRFRSDLMVSTLGDITARKKYLWGFIPLFHMPRFGGWREYVVLDVGKFPNKWSVGWSTTEVTGVSKIMHRGPVRALRGPKDASFFAVTRSGRQIKLHVTGYGRIGDGGPYAKLPFV